MDWPGRCQSKALNDGPVARMRTRKESPTSIKPPIMTLSPVWINPRVLIFARVAPLLGLKSYTSTVATPCVPPTPCTIAV